MKLKKFQPTLCLKPTQFSVGLVEVEYKVIQLKKMKKKKLQHHIEKTPVPIVISPWKELCIIDHHHFVFACWHANIEKVRVKVIRDFSKTKMTYGMFWKKMVKLNYSYPYDQFGDGPRSSLYLPMDVRGMADDPYRSLAWIVRKEGGYQNSETTFAEFRWADFFRKARLLDIQGRSGFHKALKRAIRMAKSTKARGLPGYLEKRKLKEVVEEEILPQTKYVPKRKSKGPLATLPTE